MEVKFRVVFAVLCAIVLAWALDPALAATPQPASPALMMPRFAKVLYQARIQWPDAGLAGKNLRFQLGTTTGAARWRRSLIAAVITGDDQGVRAVCERVLGHTRGKRYDQISMRCSGPLFAKPTVATFTFPNRLKSPELRAMIQGKDRIARLVYD